MEVFDWYIGEIADHEGSDVLTDETHIARLRQRALKAALRMERRKAHGKRHAATTKEAPPFGGT